MVWACGEGRGNGNSIRAVTKMNVEGNTGRQRPKKQNRRIPLRTVLRVAGVCVRDVENRDN